MDDDDDEKVDSKRKSRNLSEKKRRDQFNVLVNELSTMVSANSRKMDKSTVLKSTIAFLKNHNEVSVRSRAHEIQEDWKPSFLSNEEFTHLILEALDGFIIVFSSTGKIIYASESITSLLGHLPSDLLNMTVYDLSYEEDHTDLYNLLLNPPNINEHIENGIQREHQVMFSCHFKRGGIESQEKASFELIQFTGYFRNDVELESILQNVRSHSNHYNELENRLIFIGTGRLQTPQLIREMPIIDSSKSEFTSRHSLEWKFLFLDHRAPPIIGYLPFEVLGTSGYDYYHFDDLDKVVACHEQLLQKGEGTSCYYRFLTKGQQWIWLQTRFYITYHQWNSKPEFVVCTHRVVSYADVMKQSRNFASDQTTNNSGVERDIDESDSLDKHINSSNITPVSSRWSTKSAKVARVVDRTQSVKGRHRYNTYHGGGGNGSDSTSVSAESISSRQSQSTHFSSRSRVRSSVKPPSTSESISQMQHNQQTHIQQQHLQQMLQPPTNVAHSQNQHKIEHELSPQPRVENQRLTSNTQGIVSTFLEPTPQYLTAIPVQPVLASVNSTTATVISPLQPASELLHPGVVMTPAQNQIQDQLQRKHEELQHLIVQQQEELRRVSEQLLMARYGLLPTIVNVSVPYTTSVVTTPVRTVNASGSQYQQQESHSLENLDQMCSSNESVNHPEMQQHQHQQQQQQQQHQQHHQQNPQILTTHSSTSDGIISYMQLTSCGKARSETGSSHQEIQHQSQHHQNISQQSQQQTHQHLQQNLYSHHHPHHYHNHHQQSQLNQSIGSDIGVMPYQMSQAQAQLLFSSNIDSPNSTK